MCCAAGVVLAQAEATHSLRWHPKLGQTFDAKLTVATTGPGEAKEEMEGVVATRVEKVAPDGQFTTRQWSKGFLLKGPQGDVRDERPKERVDLYNPDGALVRIERGPKDIGAYRLTLLLRFVAPPVPVKVGDVWRYDRRADRPKGVPGVRIDYKLEGVEGDLAKVSFDFAELGGSGQTAKGTWWIRGTLGPTRLEAEVGNFLSQQGTSARVVWERLG